MPNTPRQSTPLLAEDAATRDDTRPDARELVGFALSAPRRHKLLAAAVFAGVFGASALAAVALPKTYQADVRILAQRNLVMAALGNPRRSIPNDSDAPTRGVSEAILDQENLVALVKEANLLDRWQASRGLVLRWKDSVMARLVGPMSEADRQRAMLEIVERRLTITTDEGTIHIAVQWDDPQLTYDLVSLTEKRFLQRRSDMETSVIADTIAILEAEATRDRLAVASDLAATIQLATAAAATTPKRPFAVAAPEHVRTVSAQTRAFTGSDSSNEQALLARSIATKLEDKRRAIRDVEDPWQRTLGDLRAKLAELQVTYAPAHPLVLEQERRIDDANVVPPTLAALRREETALLAQADALPASARRSEKNDGARWPAAAGSVDPLSPSTTETALARDDPPELLAARGRLQTTTRKYEDLVERIDAARIELATTAAAFKYRYRVTQPAEVPQKALKPNVPVLMGGGFLLATLFAFIAAIARDLARGRLLENWQVRRLTVPLLAEVTEP